MPTNGLSTQQILNAVFDSTNNALRLAITFDTTITTQTALSMTGFNSLTTGRILDIASNSSDASARTLVQILNDHASAAGTIPLGIVQDAANEALFIDQNGNGESILIDTEATSAHGIDFISPTQTTGNVIDIGDADALTTGGILNLVSNSADGGARTLLRVVNDNTLATGARCFFLQQDATMTAMEIDSNGNGVVFRITSSATTSAVVHIVDPANTTGIVFDIASADSLSTGSGLRVLSNSANTGTRDIVAFINDNTLATGATVLDIKQDSTGLGIDCAGPIAIAPAATAAGTLALGITPGAHTALTVEQLDFSLVAHTVTLTDTTTIALARSVVFAATTYNGVAAGGSEIVTTAIGLEVGVPVQGTNLTITNAPIAARFLSNVVIGNALTPAAGPTNVLMVASGTAPTTTTVDTVMFYSSDISAGNTEPSFYCEGTSVLATGQADSASSVRVKMRINGTEVTLLAI